MFPACCEGCPHLPHHTKGVEEIYLFTSTLLIVLLRSAVAQRSQLKRRAQSPRPDGRTGLRRPGNEAAWVALCLACVYVDGSRRGGMHTQHCSALGCLWGPGTTY